MKNVFVISTTVGFKRAARCFSKYVWYSLWLTFQCTPPICSGGLEPFISTSLLQSLSSCLAPAAGLYLHIQPVVIHLRMMSFPMSKNHLTSLIQLPQITGTSGNFTHYCLFETVLRYALVLVCFTLLPLCCCYSSGSSFSSF